MKTDEQVEREKEERLEKFKREHPKYEAIPQWRLEAMKKSEEKRKKRIATLQEIVNLRFNNKFTVQQIAEKMGVTRQAIDSRLKSVKYVANQNK